MKSTASQQRKKGNILRKIANRLWHTLIPGASVTTPDGALLKDKIEPHIIEIIGGLQRAGYTAYIVGGAVRDLLLGRKPKDYDISTSATPEEVRSVFRKKHVLIIGNRFKLVHYHFGNEIIEISTFRKKPTAVPADRPNIAKIASAPANMIFRDNEFGTPEEDAWRRDFTINALFYDPVADEIHDHTGLGLKDLHSGVVRAIGDPGVRFEEDPVRLIRALKLVGQYQFTLEENTRKALEEKKDLIRLAAESRLTLETEKILKNSFGDKILDVLHQYGILQYVIPGLDKIWESGEGRKIRSLWRIRNERAFNGEYRESISLAMAILVYPAYMRTHCFRKRPGEVRGLMEDAITNLLKPRYPTHRAVDAMLRSLTLLPVFQDKTPGNREKFLNHPGYPHARELAFVLNTVSGEDSDFESFWPKKVRKGTPPGAFRRPGKPRYRNRGPEHRGPAAS